MAMSIEDVIQAGEESAVVTLLARVNKQTEQKATSNISYFF